MYVLCWYTVSLTFLFLQSRSTKLFSSRCRWYTRNNTKKRRAARNFQESFWTSKNKFFLVKKYTVHYLIFFWKRAKVILPHVGLVILSLLYTIVGAGIFVALESPLEITLKNASLKSIRDLRSQIVLDLWVLCNNNETISEIDYGNYVENHLDNLSTMLYQAYESSYVTVDDIRNHTQRQMMWSFTSSLFFSATAITAIGWCYLTYTCNKIKSFYFDAYSIVFDAYHIIFRLWSSSSSFHSGTYSVPSILPGWHTFGVSNNSWFRSIFVWLYCYHLYSLFQMYPLGNNQVSEVL